MAIEGQVHLRFDDFGGRPGQDYRYLRLVGAFKTSSDIIVASSMVKVSAYLNPCSGTHRSENPRTVAHVFIHLPAGTP